MPLRRNVHPGLEPATSKSQVRCPVNNDTASALALSTERPNVEN